jgi:hypothetical protein
MKEIKYLLPWEPNEDGFIRKEFGKLYAHPSYCGARVFPHRDGWRSVFFQLDESYKTSVEARNACDKYLLSLIGRRYRFIKENEVERFESKLKLLL